jgi:FRG domain
MATENPNENSPWTAGTLRDGVREIQLSSFAEFFDFVQKRSRPVNGGLDLLWRGQRRAEWEIRSSLSRTGQSAVLHLDHFRDAVARTTHVEYDLDQKNPKYEENKLHLWSLGQHHELKTPLIDWTAYPFVALFFAFEELDESTPFRSVSCLNWSVVRSLNFNIVETNGMRPFREKFDTPPYDSEFMSYLTERFLLDDDEAEIVRTDRLSKSAKEQICNREFRHLKSKQLRIHQSPASENRRIHSQGGWHLYTPNDISVEAWIRDNRGSESSVMTKLLIPNLERKGILSALNQMNINYLTLFPDIEGAARHCNLAMMECGHSGFREY